jgi:predicted MPP superfamily phosphohydrolase
MPADGTSGPRSGTPPSGAAEPTGKETGRARAHARRRSRLRRFLFIAHGVTAAAHVVPALGMAVFLSASQVLPLVALALASTVWRLQTLVHAGRRPRWVTRLIDEPVLAHWCASVLATFLAPAAVATAFGARAIGLLRLGAADTALHAALASYGAAVIVCAWGVWPRRRLVRITEVDVPVEGLSPELDGYRIAQLSDLHIGNFDTLSRGLAWAERTNRLGADLVTVTGDLVTAGTEFYGDVARVLGALRARDGVFVSMGNHDQADPDALARLIEAAGPTVLRNRWRMVERGGANLCVAGVDDRFTAQDDLDGTLAARPADVTTVLLSHYPDFFADAARRGVDLVLSGHTHGGQIALPFAARRVSLSRLARQEAHGLHARGRTRLYVNAGLGTTGPPIRLGVPPEIAVLTLRRT